MDLLSRISLDPMVNHGKPTIRGKRYPVQSLLEYLAGGDSMEDLLEAFDDLDHEDLLACLAYAARMIEVKNTVIAA